MQLLVLGPGCARCKQVYDEAAKAVAAADIDVELRKVDQLREIASYGVMATPAVIIDGEVKSSGAIPKATEIAAWIAAAAAEGEPS